MITQNYYFLNYRKVSPVLLPEKVQKEYLNSKIIRLSLEKEPTSWIPFSNYFFGSLKFLKKVKVLLGEEEEKFDHLKTTLRIEADH